MVFPTVATVALLIVVYVHVNIPRFTVAGPKRLVAHAMLLLAGLCFGVVGAMLSGTVAPPWAVIAAGLGVVHLPAFCVLVIKRLRHSGRS
jgi:ABC-type transport system involved in multi-copper enzyme maturation permease subunit